MTGIGDFRSLPPLVTITPQSLESIGAQMAAGGSTLNSWTSASYPSANRAIYIPFEIATPVTVVKLLCVNGGVVSGNVDMGIYDWTGTRLANNGSVAQAGSSGIQSFDITDLLLGAGRFFLAVCLSSSSGSLQRLAGPSTEQMAAWGVYNQSGANVPLPATASFAKPLSTYIPMIGLTTRTVV